MKIYLELIDQRFVNQAKKVTLILAIVFLPLFVFLFSGQTIYAAMNNKAVFHKEGIINAVKPLVVADAPTIDIWYGDEQSFGHLGNPQEWINIMGNVSDTDGIATLTYTLNGEAAIPLEMGEDQRRLAKDGDFNVDIARTELNSGVNEVVITAVDTLGTSASKTVLVTYETGNVWPETYSIDWSTVSDIQSVAQVIDGHWQLTGDGVRSFVPDYDRLIGIGDLTWTDYEIVVPITVHSIDPDGFDFPSVQPGVGVLMRWTGHTDNPVFCPQPKCGYEPIGAIAWWQWDTINDANLEFWDTGVETDWTPQLDTQYIMKVRVNSVVGEGGNYKIKVWESGELEPANWDITYQADSSNLANGSVLLISHHVDATFGDVSVYPIGSPITYNLTTAVSGSGSVTKNPDNADYLAGETVTVTAVPNSGWIFNGWSGDVSSIQNPLTLNMSTDKNITATFVEESSGYKLTINTVGNGAITPYPPKVNYNAGETVTLTIAANSGWVFNGWSGALSGTTTPQSLVIDSAKEVTGTFVADAGEPIISNVNVYTFPTKAVIQWQTNELATSRVDYGTTASYELGFVSDAAEVLTHTLVIPNLTANTIYHYKLTSEDVDNVITSTADATFTTSALTDASGIVSDDFNDGTLNTSLWTFVNPVGDGTAVLNGTELLLSVPADVDHNIWDEGNNSARIMQPANNTDFEIDAKFASPITTKFQMQGLLVEQDTDNFLRLEYYSNGFETRVLAVSFTGGVPDPILDEVLPGWDVPMYMRVSRLGDTWFMWISMDGTNWDLAALFTHELTVNQVGVYGANATAEGPPPTVPAHTAVVDYFFNTASPINPEDANAQPLVLTTSTGGDGAGTLNINPDQPGYAYGDVVTVTAVPDGSSFFNEWTGDATGFSNPVVITMDTDKSITGNFISNSTPTYALTKTVAGNGSITVQPQKSSYLSGDVVTVTATGDPGWEFSAWSGALSGTTNPTTLTMDSNKSITATFLQDSVGPVITNVQVITSSTQAVINWNTDEPATSSVAYGTTSSYEIGTVSKPSLVLTHSITITGLNPLTPYHFQITSADEHTNSSSTVDATFTTAGANLSGIVSDDFNSYTISNTVWTMVDPIGDGSFSQNGTQLLISVPAGTSHDMWDTNDGVRLMQSVTDEDFEVDVKFESDLSQEFQMQGILVEEDSDNFIRFEFYSGFSEGIMSVWVFGAVIEDGSPGMLFNNVIGEVYPEPMYLRLKRVGDDWTFSYGNNGTSFTQIGTTHNHALTMTGIGVYAANFSNGGTPPAHTAVIDYFFNTAEPISPEDPISYQYTLDTNTVGNGSITVNPVKATYNFNEVVTVTAVPDSGWDFNNWSGDVTGDTSSKTITMNSNKTITATFIEESVQTYNLTISKVGNGNVTVTPDKSSYLAGEVVTVTAVPAAGWQFANWSGASTTDVATTQITMNANKSLTAHFTPQTFSVTTAVSGQGNVTVSPVLSSYTYGQVITLTAQPASGWEFDYWSGVIGNENPKQITVTGNVSVTATFKEADEFFIFLPMVIKP